MNEASNEEMQAAHNQFVLLMFHMKPGNVLCKRCHLLNVSTILNRIAHDTNIIYVVIVPLRGAETYKGSVTII